MVRSPQQRLTYGPKAVIFGIAERPEMEPVGRIKCKAKPGKYKRFNAQEVHGLVSEVLHEPFPLEMEG
jgi:hypothetical protein